LGQASFFQGFNRFNALASLPDDSMAEGNKREPYSSKGSSMERDRGDRDRDRNYYSGDRYGSQSGRNSNQGSRNGSQIRSRENSNSRNPGIGGSRSLQAPVHRQQSGGAGSQSVTGVSSNTGLGSRSSSGNYKDQQPQKSASQQSLQKQSSVESKTVEMSDDEIKKMCDEFKKIADNFKDGHFSFEESKEKLQKLRINDSVLLEVYNLYLDRKDKERASLSDLLFQCIQCNLISKEDNLKALKNVFDLGKDLLCDLPHVYLYIAQYLGEFFCWIFFHFSITKFLAFSTDLPLTKKLLTMKDVYYIMESECSEGGADDMLQKLFSTIETNFDKQKLCEVFDNSNVDFKQFISNKNVKQFLEKNVSILWIL
jgi:hypothetical protein